jgi:hypothetical protein
VNALIGTLFAFLLTILSLFNSSLEKCFLQNDPVLLKELMPLTSPVLITLPEPLKVSDCFSPDQSFLIMKKIFDQTTTLEFFIDQESQVVFGREGAIVQARWSFTDKKDSRKHLFRLYFYLYPETPLPKNNRAGLKIREIRAEKR